MENLNKNISFEDITGDIPYNMTNDYMFRAVLQKNQFVLKGLVGSLLHLDPESLEVEVTNPIKLGESFENKDFILDVNVKVNNKTLLNLEMQIINYGNWKERSLSYLCRSFDNVYKSHDYLEVSPVIQISFLDFELFPEYPEFFSTYMFQNIKNHIIYTDKLQFSVVELKNIELATQEDRLYGIDKWAALFKSKSWEELKSMAAINEYMKSAAETIYEVSSDENIREQCRRRAEFESYERYINNLINNQKATIDDLKQINADKDATIADKDATIADKDATIADKNATIADREAEIARILAENAKLKELLNK